MNFIWSLFLYLDPKPKSGDYRRGGVQKEVRVLDMVFVDVVFEYVSLTIIFHKINVFDEHYKSTDF